MKDYPELDLLIQVFRINEANKLATGSIVEIPIQGRYVAFVDQEDAAKVLQFKWRVEKSRLTHYAHTGKNSLPMHRMILDTPPGIVLDHKDGFGLNNTRDNLRPATAAQNCANRRKSPNPASSRFKGVSFHGLVKDKPWQVTIKTNGKKKFLGRYATENEAAVVYNEAALELFGDFARLNMLTDVD